MWAFGFFSRIERRISAVVHDLPVPVVPRMAKCLPSRSLTRTIAGMFASWRMPPTRTEPFMSPQNAHSSSFVFATRTRSPSEG
jgi:hypothetical protein